MITRESYPTPAVPEAFRIFSLRLPPPLQIALLMVSDPTLLLFPAETVAPEVTETFPTDPVPVREAPCEIVTVPLPLSEPIT